MDKRAVVVVEIMNHINRAFHVVHEHSKKAKGLTGLTGTQLWAMRLIVELSPVRVSDLAAEMVRHPSTVVGILNKLESQGLVKRIRTAEDRRVVRIEATDLGRATIEEAPHVGRGPLGTGLTDLPLTRLRDISASLERLVEILGA